MDETANMSDAALEAKVNQIGDEIMKICDDMEQQGRADDMAIEEAITEEGLNQSIQDLENICKEFDREMEQIEKELETFEGK